MTVRRSAAVAASLLTGCLALSACSLMPGGDDDDPSSGASPGKKSLANTAWTKAAPAEVAQGGKLRLAASSLPANFNPLQADAANSDAEKILAPTAGNAVRITADGGWRVDPDYATSVEVTDQDPLKVKVELNPKAVWQGGSPITAKDMVALWKAQNGTDDDFKVVSTTGYDDIADVDPGKDQFTYTVTFKTPTAEWPRYIYPRLPANITSSPKLFNTWFRTRAVSSNGPFIVESINVKTGSIVEKPNPLWWGRRPKLAKITWNNASPDVQAEAYVADELDAVDLEAGSYDTAKDTGTIQKTYGREWTQLTLNSARGALKDVDVRRAIAHAIDRRAIATKAAAALGAPATTLGGVILVPGQRGYADTSSSIAYDPTEAARLLEKAGYVKGSDGILARKGKRLVLTMPVPAETPTNSGRAALIAHDLKKVGVDVRLRTVPADSFFNGYVVPLDFDIVTFAWHGSAFPIAATKPMFYPLDSVQNFTGLENDKVGAGWDTVLRTLDDARRYKRITKLNEWLLADVPMVPLSSTPIAVGVRKGLVNYGAAQFEQPDWTIVGFTKK